MSEDNAIPIPRVLKIGSCSSLTGKSTLGYHIGCNDQSELCFRISSNSGGGYFSPNWIPLKAILSAMELAPKPLTSFALMPLFAGKSINTQSFLWACLLAEGLVQRDEENPRVYVSCPIAAFLAQVGQLIDTGTDIKVPEKIGISGSKDDVPVLASTPTTKPSKSKASASKG